MKILAFVRSTELWLPRILMGVLTLLPARVWQYAVVSSLFRGRYVGTCRRQLVSAWLDKAGVPMVLESPSVCDTTVKLIATEEALGALNLRHKCWHLHLTISTT